jgi:hypothetical protein
VLGECLSPGDDVPEGRRLDRELVETLYDPFWQMIDRCLKRPTTGGKPW